jgi:hypothetical protein
VAKGKHAAKKNKTIIFRWGLDWVLDSVAPGSEIG